MLKNSTFSFVKVARSCTKMSICDSLEFVSISVSATATVATVATALTTEDVSATDASPTMDNSSAAASFAGTNI